MDKPKEGAKKAQKVLKEVAAAKTKPMLRTFIPLRSQERSQAYLVNAERVAAGLAPASIASICRSRRRSAACHAELNLSELARRSEPTVPRPAPPAPPVSRRRLSPQ